MLFYATGIMQQQYPDTDANNSGWVTTRQAAAALGINPRRVRNYIFDGDLVAKTEGDGANKRYLVSTASLEELRLKLEAEGKLSGQHRDDAEGAGYATADIAELVRELTAELGEVRYQLGRAEARLELTSEIESPLREQLVRERERAERLEAERDRLVPDLLRERDLTKVEHERAEHFEAELRAALEARRGWFRRFFGF